MSASLYCDLVFAAELYSAYTYLVPDKFRETDLVGKRVVAPFGPRNQLGYCVAVHTQAPDEGIKVKSILRIQDEEPLFSKSQLRFYRWIADYYLAPFGMVLRAAHPAESGFKKEPFLKIHEEKSEDERLAKLTVSPEQISQKKLGTIPKEEQAMIRQMLAEKVLSWENRFPPMMKERVVAWVRVIQKPEKKLRGRQAELLDWLNSRHPAEEAVSTIMDNLKSSASPIQTLIKNGILERFEKRVILDPFQKDYQEKTRDVSLSDEQQKAVNAVIQNEKRFFPMLLQGITGSGKTEVYIAMARHIRSQGKDVLILVPEIGITPHVAGRFRAEFGKDVAIWHSQMSAGERLWTWNAIQRGEIHVVVGARSALFSPFKKIGLIIVDEEHDASYKQDDPAPRYSARDAAVWLANELAIPVILGSATPSLESYYLASTGRYHRFELTRRHGSARLPEIRIIDMFKEGRNALFSRTLLEAMRKRIQAGEQVILLQNRRGFHTVYHCRDCGKSYQCDDCSVSMTYHKKAGELRCHYCGKSAAVPRQCPYCQSYNIHPHGVGTQQVEERLALEMPGVRLIRMDYDTTKTKNAHVRILQAFENREYDILLGTQMIAKGLDFSNVTLVGVINADVGLTLPDFRAGERLFQLLYQVAGRAGRGEKAGQVIIQSYTADHPLILMAAQQRLREYYNIELAARSNLQYAPFSRMALLRFTGKDEAQTQESAEEIGKRLSKASNQYITLGPAQAAVYKIQSRYRWQILLKAPRQNASAVGIMRNELKKLLADKKAVPAAVQLTVTIDPYSTL